MDDQLDMRGLAPILLKRWAFALVATVLCAVVAYVGSGKLTKRYSATANILLTRSATTSTGELSRASFEQLGFTFADLARRPNVLKPVAAELGYTKGWSSIRSNVSARVVPRTILLEVTAEATSPDKARALADAVSKRLVTFTDPVSSITPQQIELARSTPGVLWPNRKSMALMAGAAGFIAANALVIGWELLRQRRRAGLATKATFIGRFHADSAPAGPITYSSSLEDALAIATAIKAASPDRSHLKIAVLDSETTTYGALLTTYLGVAFALAEDDAVIIDLDLDAPEIHELSGVQAGPGVAEFLSGGKATLLNPVKTVRPGLRIVRAGASRGDMPLIERTRRLAKVVELAHTGNIIIVHLPLAGSFTEAAVVARKADISLIVTNSALFVKRSARLHAALTRLGVENIAVVETSGPTRGTRSWRKGRANRRENAVVRTDRRGGRQRREPVGEPVALTSKWIAPDVDKLVSTRHQRESA